MGLLHHVGVYLLLLCACSPCYGVLVGPPPLPVGRANNSAAALRVGFYSSTCPSAEAVVQAQLQKQFLLDHTIAPALLRMLFHDSFVRGADASILLDSTPGHPAEKEALPNLTIRGFDVIGETKEAVEAVCPGVVSCADIIVMAVRDCVALAGGPKYDVPTGRLDGLVSNEAEALNLPSPAFPIDQAAESFREKGLDLEDLVVLLGAHTVGVALCGFFNDRLFNFHGTGLPDPTMNSQLVTQLSAVCPNPFFTESNADPAINLDQATPAIFDTKYYTEILEGNGILELDQEISTDPTTVGLVQSFTSATVFFPAFVQSIVKMGNIEVITGNNPNGEIRQKCNVVNAGGAKPGPAAATPGAAGAATPPVPAPGPSAKPAPAGSVSVPAPHGQTAKPPGAAKAAPPARVITPPKPTAPASQARTPPASSKPTPAAHKPAPAAPKPAPAGQKPTPVATKPAPAAPKPAPTGPVRRPPALSNPAPVIHNPPAAARRPTPPPSEPGHVAKAPRGPTGPVTPVRKPTPILEPPIGHAGKAPPATSPITKSPQHPAGHPTPARKPAPSGGAGKSPVPKSPIGHAGKSPVPKSPFGHVGKSPLTPPPPAFSKAPPVGHASKPARPPPS